MAWMREHPAPPRPDEAASPTSDPDPPGPELDEGLSSLREILVGPEQRGVAALQARLDDPERRARDMGAVLTQVLGRHAHDPDFSRALTPTIEKAITSSVQRNPRPLAEALFPIMGPAIRKAVAAGLAGMVESLNGTLELAFSRRSIAWRIEALRTGKPFAEVVLLKTLLYRVEQVFLIDRKTGLLLQHVQADIEGVRDADMVSGMLTAIGDFAKDSFQVADQASLDALKVGDLHVWIEPGPHAVVVAVIRGSAPRDYRHTLEDALEAVHLQFGEALASFNGDAQPLDGCRPILEECLRTQLLAEQPPSRRGPLVLGLAAAAAVLVWLGFSFAENRRWDRYVELLRAEPGLTVVSAERSGGRFVVTGLRDPLAADPEPLLAAAGLSADDVLGRWAPYYALDPEIVLARAREVLSPPPGVTLSLDGGALISTGQASAAWVAEARRIAPLLAGVRGFDVGGTVESGLRATIAALESEAPLFTRGSSRPVPGQDDLLSSLERHVRDLAALAEAAGQRFRVEVTGHTDEDGLPGTNIALSNARAEVVRSRLAAAATPALDLVANGVGSTQPAVEGLTEADKQRNRRVSIRVTRLD